MVSSKERACPCPRPSAVLADVPSEAQAISLHRLVGEDIAGLSRPVYRGKMEDGAWAYRGVISRRANPHKSR